jgi:hypothetical protein
MTFYQDEKRNEAQRFSNDQFKLRLSDLLMGCVPSFDNFLKEFLKSELFLNCGDSVSPVYQGTDPKDGIIDYLIDIPLASFILYDLYNTTTDEYFKSQIDLRITELTDAIGPRTGELVIKSY